MRILATFAFSFAAGIFLLCYLLPVQSILPTAVGFLFLGWLSLLIPKKQPRKQAVLLAAGLVFGLGWGWFYARQVQAPMEALVGTEQPLEIYTCDYAIPTDYGARVTVRLNSFTHGKAIYYGEKNLLDLQPGQSIQDFVQVKSASRIRDKDVTTFTSKGVFLLLYHRGDPHYGPGTKDSPRWWPIQVGRAMQTHILQLFSGDKAAFLTAILTGDKHLLSEGASADLSEAGLFHLLAVSGMHCGFLLTMVTLLTGKHRHRLVALCTIPLLIFYALLTGGSPSVVRSCIMLSLFLFAPLVERENDGLTSLSAALFLILLQNPFAAGSLSLQLSFGAMLGILLVTPKLYSLLSNRKKHGRFFRFLITGLSTTLGALAFTIPLSALYFHSLVLISPISGLLCLGAASLIFILGLSLVLLSFFAPALAGLLAFVPSLLIRYVLTVAHLLAHLPYHALYFANPYLYWGVGFVYFLFAVVYLFTSRRRSIYALAALLSAGTLLLTTLLGIWRFDADLNMIVLDIGQGQCVLLASEGNFALVDCGSNRQQNNPGEKAAQQLQSMGCHRLDYLLLTHYDFDHVSGVSSLMARMPVDTLLVPACPDDAGLREKILETAKTHGTEILEITQLKNYPFGQAELTIFPPLGEDGDNERGLTCLASTGEQDILITGDMGSVTEKKLLETYPLPDIEVLVAGHHGSKNSTSDEFLDALQPENAVISVGKDNRYGHPADETLWRLADHGCTVYRTDLQGNIHFSINQGDPYGIQ